MQANTEDRQWKDRPTMTYNIKALKIAGCGQHHLLTVQRQGGGAETPRLNPLLGLLQP